MKREIKEMKKILSFIILIVTSIAANAQTAATLSSQDIMKSNGKIYVVVAVVLVILIGLFAYVWTLDRKITKLENNN